MIHLDNGGNNEMYRDWFDHYMERGEDFDYIGLSYYPFWHGTLQMLEDNMNDMAAPLREGTDRGRGFYGIYHGRLQAV